MFSIEPQPNVVKKLQRNIDLNQFSNVSVYPLALSDSPGHVTFYLPEDGDEAMGSLRSNGRFKVAKAVEVETRRLDDLLADLGDPEIGLVKMDAEGAELLILRGATRLMSRSNKPTIIFEANEDNCKPFGYTVFELLQFVANQGYQLRQLDHEDWVATPVR